MGQLKSRLAAEGRPFHPLDRPILVDDFEDSRNGWYLHNHDDEAFDLGWGTVCRSTMTDHRYGSHGGQSGHYSLKVATTADPGHVTNAIKRQTMPYHDGDWYSTLRFETIFTYHEEPRGTYADTNTEVENPDLTGESVVRSFAFQFDLHDREHRWWPALRYHNHDGDEMRGRWQYNDGGIDPLLSEFTDVPDGEQALCWNSPNDSVPWKPNFHYLRIDLDMADRSYVELQCNDRTFDLRELPHEPSDPEHEPGKVSPWPDIDGLLNPLLTIQTNKPARSFLYLDSLVLSATVDNDAEVDR